jgi:hypothetical protein
LKYSAGPGQRRRYEEEIVMLKWHREGEQRMVETSKQKTQIQAHHKIAESATQTQHFKTSHFLSAKMSNPANGTKRPKKKPE